MKMGISVIGALGAGSLLKVKKQEHNGMLDHMIIRAAEDAEHANTNRPGAPILGSARLELWPGHLHTRLTPTNIYND